MTDATIVSDEPDDLSPVVTRATLYADQEPDGGTMRSELQIYAMLFGAQEVTLNLNFGAGGVQTYSALHPQLIDDIAAQVDEAQPDIEPPDAA